jgi:ATP-dependent exoDNAse (exonuclease V) beta subunit
VLAPGEVADAQSFVRLMTVHAAKGLEFPLVILPEVQAPLARPARDPTFLVTNDGLDLNLVGLGRPTTSDRFRRALLDGRAARLPEEMRVFYVAVTRAQHAVTFVGARSVIRGPADDRYSWRDELLRAWPRLRALGAVAPRDADRGPG